MKKFLLIILLFTVAITATFAQTPCCPAFELRAALEPCEREKPHVIDTTGGPIFEPIQCNIQACKNATEKYTMYPAMAGYNYTWQVTGGAIASGTGNTRNITWGIGNNAVVTVYISNTNGTCRDTLQKNVCLTDAPKASFTMVPNATICANSNIQFTNTSVGGTSYYWNFGDGTTSTLENPSHTYTMGGNYDVKLTVSSATGGGFAGQKVDCSCKDIATTKITVKRESGLTIVPGCKKMLCAGDTASYCAGSNCVSYNWVVTGGRIINGNKGKCITVIWDGGYPATVSMSGNCGGACGNTATIDVPVLYATMPIKGKNIVCPTSVSSYSLPTMPGTNYTWKLNGGGAITGPDVNTSSITVQWGSTVGSYTITCEYDNANTGCKGKAEIEVKILPPYTISGLEKFCVGHAFNYTANGPGAWVISPARATTPNTFPVGSAITGTWNKPGVYTITATPTITSNFCSYPATITVEVLDTPKLTPIVGNPTICPSSTAVYSVGSNMNEPYFIWTATGGTVQSLMGKNHDSVAVKWDATGPYSLSVVQNANGCTSSPKVFNLAPNAAPTFTGPTIACMDKTFTYTSSSIANSGDYTWSLNNANGTITSGQGTNTITVLWHGNAAPGTASSIITLSTCAGSHSLTVQIESSQPVIITSVNNLCSPTGTTLTSGVSGSNYQWFLNNAVMGASYNTQAITVSQPGNYSVVVTSANACTAKGNIKIEASNFPKASISTPNKLWWKCTETINTTFTALPNASGYCYMWFKDGATIASGSATYTATTPGKYWCLVNLCNTGCKSYSDTLQIIKEVCDTGVNCNPNYTYTLTRNACNPFNFQLQTTPAAAATTAHWYFGDGCAFNQGYGLNVSHSYDHIGNYNVCAIFGAPPYCRKDTCFTFNVPLVARFGTQINCNKVKFTNLSESITTGYTSSWTFTGGTPATSTAQNPPDIIYATPGTYQIKLVVTNGTCSETYIRNVVIDFPTASAIIPSPICATTQAPFSASGTGTGLNYSWNFGDGFISNLQNTTHTYQSSGSYTVKLTVTDTSGCMATDSNTLTVLAPLRPSIGSDRTFCPGASTTLTVTPGTFASYQWYHNRLPISGATSASLLVTTIGQYWVLVGNGPGCTAISNKIQVLFNTVPIAKIRKKKIECKTTGTHTFWLQNLMQEMGCTYTWSGTGVSFQNNGTLNSFNTMASVNATGSYAIVLTVTNAGGCHAKDTICVEVVDGLLANVVAPSGTLCEGNLHTFTASATPPALTSSPYFYQWSNGVTGQVLQTGNPTANSVTVTNDNGCTATAYAPSITMRANVSLFPVGCDTLCVTDTLRIPMPVSSTNAYPYSPSSYTITWYDSGTPVGNGFWLPLANIMPGDHHLTAIVKMAGGCSDTTGMYDLYVKDCNLPPPCNKCTEIVSAVRLETTSAPSQNGAAQYVQAAIEITIKKPAREVRISLANLAYYWNDTTCNNCKATPLESGCLLPVSSNQTVGGLTFNNYTNSSMPPATTSNNCPGELVWKPGSVLQPGTYTIPFQISVPKAGKSNCKLSIEKICANITVLDEDCNICEQVVCRSTDNPGGADCGCNASNEWNSLYMVPTKPGIQKTNNQILCGSTLQGYQSNTPYLLSGVYHCKALSCMSVKNSVVVKNQTLDIIYTHVGAMLYETIQFPVDGLYTITLTANCANKECECVFKVNVITGTVIPPVTTNPPIVIGKPTTPTYSTIDSVLKQILPPDFCGGILVAKEDTIIYEKYKGTKDIVNSKTAFDLASIAKTFTGMAILKMAEEKQLHLDDNITMYLPSFPYANISIRMMLSHRSGLEDYVQFMETSGWDKTQPITNVDLLNYMVDNKQKVQIAQPNTAFDYSNTNFAMLALVIEKVSGLSYKKFMAKTFFTPLQMNDTYVFGKEDISTATKSYYKNGKPYAFKYLDLIYGDKNIYSTVQDMLKWDKALRSNKLFSKATTDLAFTPTSKLVPYTSNYGLGWRMLLVPNGKKLIYHNGWWHGNRAVFIRMLDEKAVIIILSNSSFTTISNSKKLTDLFGQYEQTIKSFINF